MQQPARRVGAQLRLQVSRQAEAAVQIAVSGRPGAVVTEELTIRQSGRDVALREVAMAGEGRVHLARLVPGAAEITYQAQVLGSTGPAPVTDADRLRYLRPTRYAESDRLAAVARAEFAGLAPGADLLSAVSSWVGTRLAYVPGSSRPTDGAVQTLLSRQGVCRDYAHLVIALLRALDVPARLVAVYAPGLDPMDFHAVAEVALDGHWQTVDATLLAPRASLVRIATGRDAADTAFLSTYGGIADLVGLEVTAVTDGRLPSDNPADLVAIS